MQLQETLPIELGGHESFPFRYSWPKKAVDQVSDNPGVFTDRSAVVAFGVGKNMVRAIRHWALALCVVSDSVQSEQTHGKATLLEPTIIGRSLFSDNGWDPYIERIGTSWLLHWYLVADTQRATTWSLAFSSLNRQEFTADYLSKHIEDYLSRLGVERAASTLKRDARCFFQTYVRDQQKSFVVAGPRECPLTELNLLTSLDSGRVFRFNFGPKPTLPPEVFGYTLGDYLIRRDGNMDHVSFEDCLWGFGSPGQAFKLDETSFITYVEMLEEMTSGDVQVDETAGLKQIYIRDHETLKCLLRRYYEPAN